MDWRALLIVSGAVIFFSFILTAREQSTAERFFFEALRSHDITADVLVDGRTVSVRSGEVTYQGETVTGAPAFAAMRLAYARTLAERSPLFALPGTLPSDLIYAVEELQQTANQLADIQKDAESADLIRSSLYPIDFLRKAAKAEAARIAFMHDSDTANEQAYYGAVREEFTAYILGIHNFRNGIIKTVPDTTPPYVAAGKLVSKEAILSAMGDIEARAKKTKRAFDARVMCLLGHTPRCNPQDLLVPTLPEPPADVSDDSVRAALSIQAMYAHIVNHDGVRPSPLIVLSKSACVSDFPSPPIYYVAVPELQSDIPPIRRGIYIGDIRLIDIREYGNLPFYRDLQSRGIEFVLSPPLPHYECMEGARDLSAILFTEDIMQEASSTSRVYYQSEAVGIANALARTGDPDGVQYVLSAQNHSAHFDQSLRSISGVEQMNVNLVKSGVEAELKTYNLFFSRSGFESLFAVGNPSFVGDVSLFEPISLDRSKGPYVYYSNFPDGEKKNKILQDIRSYISLHLENRPRTP